MTKILVEDLLGLVENGSCHILLYDVDGVILLKTIWYNLIPKDYMKRTIKKIIVDEYEMKIEVEIEKE